MKRSGYFRKKPSPELESISRHAGKAIVDYKMINEGDKILVAVSGGKDSLTLLHVLNFRKTFMPIKFDIMAVHIDMGMPNHDTKELEQYFKDLDVPYRIEKLDFLKGNDWKEANCFWCSWNRRKALFKLARDMGCLKIALGHHLDDIVETILLNMFYRAEIGAMKPYQEFFGGELAIIRPLAYEEEKDIAVFAETEGFLFKTKVCQCPHDQDSKRKFLKKLIMEIEKDNHCAKKNIFQALKNIKKDYLLTIE